MAQQTNTKSVLEPLKVTCTSSDCDNGLHCFKATKKLKAAGNEGACRSCGTKLVDWDRVRGKNLGDVEHTFAAMRLELIRHYFWHVEIDEKAHTHARRKGKIGLESAVRKRIRQSVGKEKPFRDGTQTPFKGNIIFYAQHATASCCRKCVEYWHGIPIGRPLSDAEIEYLAELALRFINERMPDLPKDGEPDQRKKQRGDQDDGDARDDSAGD
jgi:hypothetical protein